MSLILHAGAEKATIDQVRAVVTPDSTESWFPIPHATLIDRAVASFEEVGLRVVDEAHGLWERGGMPGARYFGMFEVENGNVADDHRLLVGLRNSHDKKFAAQIAAGSRVFVCDNLAFSGEVQVARMHTRWIERDLARLVSEAVGKLPAMRDEQEAQFAAWKGHELTVSRANDLLVQAVERQVIPITRLPAVKAEFVEPTHEEFEGRTAWSLFNAFTEVLKTTNRGELVRRTTALTGLLSQATGLTN